MALSVNSVQQPQAAVSEFRQTISMWHGRAVSWLSRSLDICSKLSQGIGWSLLCGVSVLGFACGGALICSGTALITAGVSTPVGVLNIVGGFGVIVGSGFLFDITSAKATDCFAEFQRLRLA